MRTVRADCLDWLLVVNARHLERVLRVFIDHYNQHRPHRGLDLFPPDRRRIVFDPSAVPHGGALTRRDRLGGLLHEHRLAA